jgi:hypothetical protein
LQSAKQNILKFIHQFRDRRFNLPLLVLLLQFYTEMALHDIKMKLDEAVEFPPEPPDYDLPRWELHPRDCSLRSYAERMVKHPRLDAEISSLANCPGGRTNKQGEN